MKINKLLKNIFLLVTSCFLLVTLNGCARSDIKNMNSRGTEIICFGDSITAGYGVKPDENYPSLLSKLLNMPVINAGIEADTSTEGLRRLETDVLDRDPFLVIIEFGGNDFLDKIPVEETLNNIRQMAERIQEKGAMAAIVDISADIFLNEYGPLLSKLAREKGAIFIPKTFSGIIANSHLKVDFLHPNVYGYIIIAHRIYRSVLPYVNQNRILKRFVK